jgi:hypothetical protein
MMSERGFLLQFLSLFLLIASIWRLLREKYVRYILCWDTLLSVYRTSIGVKNQHHRHKDSTSH